MQPTYRTRSRRPASQPPPPPPPKRKKKFPWWSVAVIVLCLGLLGAAWVYAEGYIGQYDAFNDMRAAVAGDTFFGPVYVDDMLLTGMTMEAARAALSSHAQAQAQAFEVILTHGDQKWRISSEEVPMSWNTESLLQRAYMVGRIGSLEQRYQQITTMQEPVYLHSEFTYDKDAVRALTNSVAQSLTVSPVDAAVVAFDVANRNFAYSPDQTGRTVDANRLYQQVIDQLDNGQYGTVIAVETTELPANITLSELQKNYTRIASFTTKTTSDKNRNTNIDLAAQALNGVLIKSGETISFNETTGQRLAEKGYKEAGAIKNGTTVQELGGGVCQVSSTMFNALVRAGAEIVTRRPHAWPSDYVPRGEDATVDWPGTDLVMRNTSDAPMFLAAWYENEKVTVEVYGLSLGEGVSIELESVTTYSKEPTEVVYTYNPNLSYGTQKEVKKARTGYSVQTYKILLQDGQEVSREKFYVSEYRVINKEIQYNSESPPG